MISILASIIAGIIGWLFGLRNFELSVIILLVMNLFSYPDLSGFAEFFDERIIDLQSDIAKIQSSCTEIQSNLEKTAPPKDIYDL